MDATKEIERLKEVLSRISAAYATGGTAAEMQQIACEGLMGTEEFIALYGKHSMDGVPR